MDVTSLLNQSAYCKVSPRETTPSSCALSRDKLSSSASLPTPSPDRMTPQHDWEPKTLKSRKPWNAGGYALPLQSENTDRSNSVFSFRSASENLESDASYESSVVERHSRTGSVDSASVDMETSHSSLPQAQVQERR